MENKMTRVYKRRQLIIDRAFQVSFIVRFASIVIVTSLLIGVGVYYISQSSTTAIVNGVRIYVKPTLGFQLQIVMTVAFVGLCSAVYVAITSLFISHRIAGPALRLRREVDLLASGDLSRNFTIREKDKLKCLAGSLAEMATALRERHSNLKEHCNTLSSYLKEKDFQIPESDKKKVSKILDDIQTNLNYFKVQ